MGGARRTAGWPDIQAFLGAALAVAVAAGVATVLINGMFRQLEAGYSAYLSRHVATAITVYNVTHEAPIASLEDAGAVYETLTRGDLLDLSEKQFLEGVTNVKLVSKGQNIIMARYSGPDLLLPVQGSEEG